MANSDVKNADIKRGLLRAYGLMCVQKKKNNIGESGDYYYNLGFTDGTNMLLVTAGKYGDFVECFKKYDIDFDYTDKKLKLVYLNQVD